MALEATKLRAVDALRGPPELLRNGLGPNRSDDGVIREGVPGASSVGIAGVVGPVEGAAGFEGRTGFWGITVVNPSSELVARPAPKRRIRCRPVAIPGSDTDFGSLASPSSA
jgi:hypothetical protein